MTCIYLAGKSANAILGATISQSSENSVLPWDNLNDQRLSYCGQFNAAASGDFIHALVSSITPDFVSVHFDSNVADTGITSVQLRRGASGATNVVTMTRDPAGSYYATFVGVADTNWRLLFNGTPAKAGTVGKW
jgi:hypothetical protein